MRYEIQGGNLPVAILHLEPGEAVYTESRGMGWMGDNFRMDTNMEGGLLGGLARKLAGESLFITTYTCVGRPGEIAFPSSFPGTIIPVELPAGVSLICQRGSFLCAEKTVKLEMHFRKRLGAGLFGGEGFILQRLTGPGMAFLEIDGAVIEKNLAPGEVLKVDTGHVALMDASVHFDIETVKGFTNVLFGGEGLFLTRLQGPGRVWLQTMPLANFATQLIPFLPAKD